MQHEQLFGEKGEDRGKDHAHKAFTGKRIEGAARRPAVKSASNILWLGESAARDLSLVGGKTANLSLLTAKYPVPPGFCLTTDAFDKWTGGDLPPALYGELVAAYRKLADLCGVAELGVAVRSSAVDEDGAAASFAGQHESYLNVAGAEAVAGAVVRCWASARTERAVEYRRQKGLGLDSVRLAVLVQRLVPADVSAVVFSMNPVTGSQNEILINANWGLGESLVGGTVTPDAYVVNREELALSECRISEKRRMTVAVSGGTREVEVPGFLRDQASLSEEQAVEIARLALALEKEMGWPVDLECAYAGGRLFLLQCRPVTTLRLIDKSTEQ
jgi:phosphoenolpyruvate synthase/pyruvate phosphate dikinase